MAHGRSGNGRRVGVVEFDLQIVPWHFSIRLHNLAPLRRLMEAMILGWRWKRQPIAHQAGSVSPDFNQLKWIGNPSPTSMLTISDSGNPTTFV